MFLMRHDAASMSVDGLRAGACVVVVATMGRHGLREIPDLNTATGGSCEQQTAPSECRAKVHGQHHARMATQIAHLVNTKALSTLTSLLKI